MKKLFVIMMSIVLLLSMSSVAFAATGAGLTSPQAPFDTVFDTYKDNRTGLSFCYPEDWELKSYLVSRYTTVGISKYRRIDIQAANSDYKISFIQIRTKDKSIEFLVKDSAGTSWHVTSTDNILLDSLLIEDAIKFSEDYFADLNNGFTVGFSAAIK